jgi:thiamine kinase-like enzyme
MIKADEVTDSDLGQIVGFLKSLKELTALPESRSQPQASEACFSVGAIRDSIGRRWDRLREVPRTSHVHLELHNFLSSEFAPVLETITRWCAARLQEAGLSWDSELPQMERTLSPSDFGFHNALRCDGGRIVFLDFEYFGWDDPAKMVSDFLLHPHPAMDIPEALKRRFVEDVFQAFADQANLRWRVATVYPLLGLNWCLLLLNEFVNEHLVRRLFAAEETEERSRIQRRQLDAARRMLRRMEREYEAFPYDN